MPEWSPKANEIFLAAAEIASPDECERYLNEACVGDVKLRDAVETLLRSRARAARSRFLEPHADSSPTIGGEGSRSAEAVGTLIGNYKLLERIGEGGFGVVFMAEQIRPVQRQVAIKIIKPGMDSAQVIARFEAERQALALMDHPNIAKVLEAGTTDAGRPYFVMELVRGVPITKYCDQEQLTPQQRLQLFIPVCQAVQHAHQKGVIHRDLKPSNVLVGLYDGRPVPKVIDFGVAKAIAQKLTERTVFTQLGAIVGTLEYMSPEQAELNNLDIDTRADIYSLGVILYELLTGAPPFAAAQLRGAAFDQMLRMIREVEPQKPSTKLSTAAELASIAANRKLEPKRLTRLMHGELDWIVMKCLEKERTRRYETANGLSLDVQRYLADEPVTAGAPSAAYRLRKFIRRNRAAVLAATTIALLLTGGVVGTTWALFRERQARATAEAREAETKAVLDFVQDKIFAAARPAGQDGGLGRDVTMRNAVDAALPFVEESFADQPLIEARLRLTLGNSFSYLGDAKLAAEQFQAARALYARHSGPDHPDTLTSMNNIAICYADLGRHADALKLREETLAIQKQKLGLDHLDTLRSMLNLASSYADLGRHADALKLREETLDLMKAKLGLDHPNTISAMNNLAISLYKLGRHAEALKVFEETWALRKAKLGADHPDTLRSMSNVAVTYADLGRHEDALKLREETLALQKHKLGPDHPQTLMSMNNLANSYTDLERHTDALKLREETLALRSAKLGPDHPDTLNSMNNLAITYADLGRHADALKLREETLALMTAKLGSDHPQTLSSMSNLANSYHDLGRHAEAVKLREETLAQRKAKLGDDHPDTLQSMANVAESYVALDRHAEALLLIDECLARAAGKTVREGLVTSLRELRLEILRKKPATTSTTR